MVRRTRKRSVRLSRVEREAIAHALRSWLGLVTLAVASGARPAGEGKSRLEGWVVAAGRLMDRPEFRDMDEYDE